ncbi:hypothetical protein QA612_14800 [Evansella sp. AB-P1]|uniref:hypothetical protein n=1 Tax=Evansella sp. AB-P1 TaxID=3037653 RepID=UPI00241D22F8|nr:hypothetical protein [Evansella sp. AB-P1]MDG5788742.1 hypothetical protein [Evansella sp. AB-P1]
MKLLKEKKVIVITFTLSFTILILFLLKPFYFENKTSVTMTYFPEDDQVSFSEKSTEIQLLELKDENEYLLEWRYHSVTDSTVFFRKDISLLFENGSLLGIETDSKQNTDKLNGVSSIHGEDSGRHEAITYHFAEIHYPNDLIKSKFSISSNTLYVIDSSLSPILTFREAKNTMEKRSKELLDSIIDQQLTYIWEGLMEEFQIDQRNYYLIPFNNIDYYVDQPLPSFSREKSTEIIGKLWDGLYRTYISGIDTFNDSTYSPIGSSIPLILLHNEGGHLIILFETADGTKQQLLQHIE